VKINISSTKVHHYLVRIKHLAGGGMCLPEWIIPEFEKIKVEFKKWS